MFYFESLEKECFEVGFFFSFSVSKASNQKCPLPGKHTDVPWPSLMLPFFPICPPKAWEVTVPGP